MADRAYEYMDWRAIEGIVYSEEHFPRKILSPRQVKEGTLYQCFLPGAESVELKELKSGRRHPMTLEDENGWFALILSGKKPVPHVFLKDGEEVGDPYAFGSFVTEEEEARFASGIASRIYKKLGAHETEADGQKGVLFALWAPNALRVSVVGDFNGWDGRVCPMEFHENSGIHELFIPGLRTGCRYNYELKLPDGLVYTRPDPYATGFDRTGEKPVSVCADLSYRWHDRDYLERRSKKTDTSSCPLAFFECSLAKWREKTGLADYRSLADNLADYAAAYGYTHVELTPVMEYADDTSSGYQTTGYYAPTDRYGEPAAFKYLVDTLHQKGIGVILDWTPAQFSADTDWLASYDGTCLYEHLDPRQGVHPLWGSKIYNYGRPQVRSFLISNATFWMREYHVDGLRIDGASTMLRLDWQRGSGWVANMYGSNENLEGIDFLKSLSSVFKKSFPDGLLILEEETDFPDVTASTEDEGLGFDYKWNLHFTEDLLHYLSLDQKGRKSAHELLLNGMLHNYLEHFVISLSRGMGYFDPDSFLAGIDGKDRDKKALVRAAYGYLFLHPGKKLLADGEDFGSPYLADLISLYEREPALSLHDFEEDGFEWINTMDDEHLALSFLRKGERKEDTLLVVANFSDEDFPLYQVGVPYPGKYKEILNSDDLAYGGSGKVNPRARAAREVEFDERKWSLNLRLAARAIAVFRYQK